MRRGIFAPRTPAGFDAPPDVPALRGTAPRIGRGGLGRRAGRGAPVPLSARRDLARALGVLVQRWAMALLRNCRAPVSSIQL